MHHDLQRGRPLEIRWLSGGVVQLGNAVGVATPLNRAIADILAPYEAGAPAASQPKASSAPMRGDRGVISAHQLE
jgi:2-dehydropantoate 2-reductase